MTPLAPSPLAPYRIHRYPSAPNDGLALADGRAVTIRPVLPQDAQAEQAFVAALSPLARRRRFQLGVGALPDALARALTELDGRNHVALVAEDADAPGTDALLVADARYVVDDSGRHGEFAIAVADDWQGIGLGRALLQRLARHAHRQGLRKLWGDVLADNVPMLSLIERLGGRVSPHLEEIALVRVWFATSGAAAQG